jgi:hypothetical protein
MGLVHAGGLTLRWLFVRTQFDNQNATHSFNGTSEEKARGKIACTRRWEGDNDRVDYAIVETERKWSIETHRVPAPQRIDPEIG